MKNGEKIRVEMPNKVYADNDSESIDAHILQKLNIKQSNYDNEQLREDSDQLYSQTTKLFKQKVQERHNKNTKLELASNEYKQDSTQDKTDEEWKAHTIKLKRENSQKIILKNTSLTTNQREN